ncbi:MAG TPA: hypothetical protein VND93_17515, partial [Myxococcales bacterium]|nr:hypothetical protein [Myxococcales bacterium]
GQAALELSERLGPQAGEAGVPLEAALVPGPPPGPPAASPPSVAGGTHQPAPASAPAPGGSASGVRQQQRTHRSPAP